MKLFEHGQDAQMVLDEVLQFWNFHIGDAWPGLPYPIADHHRGDLGKRQKGLPVYCSPDNYYPKSI